MANVWRVVKTSPSSFAEKGDSVICLEDVDYTAFHNAVFHNIPKDSNYSRVK